MNAVFKKNIFRFLKHFVKYNKNTKPSKDIFLNPKIFNWQQDTLQYTTDINVLPYFDNVDNSSFN